MKLAHLFAVLSAPLAISPLCLGQTAGDLGIEPLAEPFRLDFGTMQDEPEPVPEASQDDWRVDPAILATRRGSEDWIDPIIGVRTTLQLSDRFDVSLVGDIGDIGGFGVGSDLTWSLRGVIGDHFEMFDIPSTVFAGYAALGTDFSDGSGITRFEWDTVMHGPIFGLTLSL